MTSEVSNGEEESQQEVTQRKGKDFIMLVLERLR